jgi:carboxylesterase
VEWNEPIYHQGSGTGVLVIHGFSGSPRSMQEYASLFADHGFSVAMPLLAGHGAEPSSLEHTKWTDWIADVEKANAWLRERTDQVFATGLSMGGTLAVSMAERHPELAGIITINAALHYGPTELLMRALGVCGLPRYVKAVGNDIKKPGEDECAYAKIPVRATRQLALLMRAVRRDLDRVTCPALIFSSRDDHVIRPANQQLLYRSIGSQNKQLVMLDDSNHVATMDNDKKRIFAGALEFLGAHIASTDG